MSQYWDKMLILKNNLGSESSKDLLISQEPPVFFAPKGPFTIHNLNFCEKNTNEKILDELSSFYCKNNVLASGNMTKVSKNDLKKYMNAGLSEIVYLRNKISKDVIGSILNVLLPIRLNMDINLDVLVAKTERYRQISSSDDPRDVVFAVTTFLNNAKNWRGKGLGMVLIQKSLQLAYDAGVVCAYFLNTTPRCTNAVEIKCWTFPLNIPKLQTYKISFNRRYIDYYLGFSSNDVQINLADHKNKELHERYLSLVKDKKFALFPDWIYWKRWVENFNTYGVIKNKEIIGVFSIIKYTVYVPACGKEIEYGNRLFCAAEKGYELDVCKALLVQAQKEKIDIILLQEIGDWTNEILTELHAQKSKVSDYLNFYNTQIKLEPSDIYAPMI